VRECHFNIKFKRERETKVSLPVSVTVGMIRDTLNRTLFDLKSGAYFSIASTGRWSDILLTLADTKVEDIAGYNQALSEALEGLSLYKFIFSRDTKKVKVLVGMVPLSRFGSGWTPSKWKGSTAFNHFSADIENSNPSVIVPA